MRCSGRDGSVRKEEEAAHGVAMVFLAMAFAFSVVLPLNMIRHVRRAGDDPASRLSVVSHMVPRDADRQEFAAKRSFGYILGGKSMAEEVPAWRMDRCLRG